MRYIFIVFILVFYIAFSPELVARQLVSGKVNTISRVTGKSLKGETLPNPNNTHLKYDVCGTDLGIMWDMGNGKSGILFGDTFGGKNWIAGDDSTNWRCNVLGFSSDQKLSDGLSIDHMVLATSGGADEIVYGGKDKSGLGNWTTIPTAAIRVNKTDYIHYMNVKKWGVPGEWATNCSGFAISEDDGKNWKFAGKTFPSQSRFSQCALAKDDQFVYLLGTISGRSGDVYLAKCLKNDLLDSKKYSYWQAGQWVSDEKDAFALFKGPAGELSIMYNTHFKKWIVVYLNSMKKALVMRSADRIDGQWSEEAILLPNKGEYAGLYGGYIHSTINNSKDLYFLVSLWGKYNVFLMHTELTLK